MADAIDKEDDNALIEELGDVLLQVVFHSAIGKEDGYFNFNDIVEGICNKMVYRHPHVFGDANMSTSSEVLLEWEELKKKEKSIESVTEDLEGIAKALPALIRAEKIQKKASKVGFDWDEVEEAIKKVREEINELIEVYNSENKAKIVEEVGDLIFACVNVSRFLKVDSEEALNLTSDKFIRRFNYIETKAKSMNIKLEEMTLEEMDKLWEEAKKLEK